MFLSAKYQRMILLPRSVRDCLQEQVLRQWQERAYAGTQWQQQDLVLCTEQGYPLTSDYLTSLVQNLLRQAHAPVLRFHELRHTTAYLLLTSGIAPELVGAILGIGMRWTGHGQLVPFSLEHYEQVQQAMEKLFFEQ
jgi:site-specific recombinase XerD